MKRETLMKPADNYTGVISYLLNSGFVCFSFWLTKHDSFPLINSTCTSDHVYVKSSFFEEVPYIQLSCFD